MVANELKTVNFSSFTIGFLVFDGNAQYFYLIGWVSEIDGDVISAVPTLELNFSCSVSRDLLAIATILL